MSDELPPIGFTTAPYEHTITWHKAVLYALGIGAGRDELDYVYEARGPRVYPTYGVIPAFAPVVDIVGKVGGSFANLVHGSQSIVVRRPIPPEGVMRTTARLEGMYDLKRMAQVVVSTHTEMDGVPLLDTSWMLLLFDRGGFGGPRPPKPEKVEVPAGKEPDFSVTHAIPTEQALLYRLSGDTNPLHIDPEFAKNLGFDTAPILHGLCTFGYVARSVIRSLCGGDADRLEQLHAHFKKPVWPGDSLVTSGVVADAGRVALTVKVEGREEPVLGHAWAKVKAD